MPLPKRGKKNPLSVPGVISPGGSRKKRPQKVRAIVPRPRHYDEPYSPSIDPRTKSYDPLRRVHNLRTQHRRERPPAGTIKKPIKTPDVNTSDLPVPGYIYLSTRIGATDPVLEQSAPTASNYTRYEIPVGIYSDLLENRPLWAGFCGPFWMGNPPWVPILKMMMVNSTVAAINNIIDRQGFFELKPEVSFVPPPVLLPPHLRKKEPTAHRSIRARCQRVIRLARMDPGLRRQVPIIRDNKSTIRMKSPNTRFWRLTGLPRAWLAMSGWLPTFVTLLWVYYLKLEVIPYDLITGRISQVNLGVLVSRLANVFTTP